MDIDHLIDRFIFDADEYRNQASDMRNHGLETGDAYWRGRSAGLQEAAEALLRVRRADSL